MVKGEGFEYRKRRGEANIMQDETVGLQRGARVYGDLYSCIQGQPSSDDF